MNKLQIVEFLRGIAEKALNEGMFKCGEGRYFESHILTVAQRIEISAIEFEYSHDENWSMHQVHVSVPAVKYRLKNFDMWQWSPAEIRTLWRCDIGSYTYSGMLLRRCDLTCALRASMDQFLQEISRLEYMFK